MERDENEVIESQVIRLNEDGSAVVISLDGEGGIFINTFASCKVAYRMLSGEDVGYKPTATIYVEPKSGLVDVV